jgi:hypothetical protein
VTSKLALYNSVCAILAERKLASLSENVVMRRRLDTMWDDDFIKKVLQQGLWNFAIKDVELSYSPSVVSSFGFLYAFDKPTDWVRTAILSCDDSYGVGFRAYEDHGSYWYADQDTIWVRYVSDDVQWGGDLSLWTPAFTTFAEHYAAWRVARITTGSKADAAELEVTQRRLLIQARSGDAMDEASRGIPQGSWVGARRGGTSRER